MTDQYSEDMEALKEKTGYYDKNPHERKTGTMSIKTEIENIVGDGIADDRLSDDIVNDLAQLFASELEKLKQWASDEIFIDGVPDRNQAMIDCERKIQALIDSLKGTTQYDEAVLYRKKLADSYNNEYDKEVQDV